MDKVSPWLCNGNAQEMAEFYVSLLPGSRVVEVVKPPGDNTSTMEGEVLTVEFELDGRSFFALNGGPLFEFNEAVSFQILCDD